jgi:Domain of unknown function (DUF4382)
MRGRRLAPLSLLAILLVFAAFGCSKSSTSPGFGTVKLRLTDAPGDFQEVNLAVAEVSAHFEGAGGESDSTGGWQVLRAEPLNVDLLTLRNGVFTTLAVTQVPAGHYTQIRLKLASGSNVVVDGVTHPLTVPSGMQSGYKLVGGFDVPAGGLLDLTLDFDAARSVVLTGSGTYILKPTVRVIQTAASGSITGHVSPDSVSTSVFAIQAADTIGSTVTSAGAFTVGALPAGTYSLAFHPATAYRDTTLNNVAVSAGATTNVGTVQLTPQ